MTAGAPPRFPTAVDSPFPGESWTPGPNDTLRSASWGEPWAPPCATFYPYSRIVWKQDSVIVWRHASVSDTPRIQSVAPDGPRSTNIARPKDASPHAYRQPVLGYFDLSPDGSTMLYSTCTYPIQKLIYSPYKYNGFSFTPYRPRDQSSIEWPTSPADYQETSRYDYRFELHTSGLDGSGRHALTEHPRYHGFTAWSPDGTSIAFIFVEWRPYGYSGGAWLATMAADGSDVQAIAHIQGPHGYTRDYTGPLHPPVWSPDGSLIALAIRQHGLSPR